MTETILPLLETYLRTVFPERPGIAVNRLQSLNTGWESDVYAFDAAWNGEEVPLILRIYPGSDADEKSVREFHNLRVLKKLGYPVPRVDRLETSAASPFGKPFLLMERVPGRGMWGPMFRGAPEERARLLEQFCALFARLHALDPRPFDPNLPEGANSVQSQFARWEPLVGTLPLPGFLPGWQWLARRAPEIRESAFSPCHWDFHPENILVDDFGGAVVIDWTGLEVTDRRFDVAWTLLLICGHEGEGVREPILRGYERHAGVTLRDMDFFEAVACFRRLFSVLASLAVGAEKMGMRGGAEEIMRRQARALIYVYERWLAVTATPITEAEDFLRQIR